MVFSLLIMLLVALLGFFIIRASVRANEQIKLLQEIAEQQREQTLLLQRLVGQIPGRSDSDGVTAGQADIADADDFRHVIPER
ncbi:YebO family protein [Affinibrenneria salicis]